MLSIPVYQVDAFTQTAFAGNPAAVCPLDNWLSDKLLQNIAAENNLAETAFVVADTERPAHYQLRWFTPAVEIDLCGHATLASAWVIFHCLQARQQLQQLHFHTQSGELIVRRQPDDSLSLDFPARMPQPLAASEDLKDALQAAFGLLPAEIHESRDLVLVFESEAQIRALEPDFHAFARLTDHFAVITTARGEKVDFVSRFFAPNAGIPEDPVTGSAHCSLIPFWAERLQQKQLHALQLSPRGGELFCEHQDQRVTMSGHAVLFMQGTIQLPV